MTGPEGAADRVVGWLTTALPRRLRLLEARLATVLPNPAVIAAQERGPLGLEDWPAVFVLPQRLDRLETVEQALEGAETYRATYVLRVLAWVRAETYDTTDDLRKRYTLAIREALLERKQLAARHAYGTPAPTGPEFAVVPSTIREDYGPVLTDEAKRTIAGVYLDVNVTVLEVLDGPAPMGTADDLTVTVTPAPRTETLATHPGLE